MATMTFKANLVPNSNAAQELGSSSVGWKITKLNAPTTSGGSTYGAGTSGQVLKTNGSTIYWANDDNSVTGIKGDNESSYRTGNVNITAANLGLANGATTTISSGTAAPSGGSDGDIYFQYTA